MTAISFACSTINKRLLPSTLRNVWEATCICIKLLSMGYDIDSSSDSSTSMFTVHGRSSGIGKLLPASLPAAGKIDDSQEFHKMLRKFQQIRCLSCRGEVGRRSLVGIANKDEESQNQEESQKIAYPDEQTGKDILFWREHAESTAAAQSRRTQKSAACCKMLRVT